MNARKKIVTSLLVLMAFSSSLFAEDVIIVPRDPPVVRTPIFVPFSASLESSFIIYQSTISYTGVTVEIEDENGGVVESQTLNIVAGTTYTISVNGLDDGEYSIACY